MQAARWLRHHAFLAAALAGNNTSLMAAKGRAGVAMSSRADSGEVATSLSLARARARKGLNGR